MTRVLRRSDIVYCILENVMITSRLQNCNRTNEELSYALSKEQMILNMFRALLTF